MKDYLLTAFRGGEHLSPELLLVLQSQRLCRGVTDLSGSVVLNSAGIDEGSLHRPFCSVCRKELERCAVKLNECLSDNGLIFAVSALDVHHLGDGHAACYPLFCRCREVGDLGEVSCEAVLDQHEGIVAEGIAIVAVKVGRERASSFITEEVCQSGEFALVGSCRLALCQLVLYQLRKQFLGLDQRYLFVAVRVSLISLKKCIIGHCFYNMISGAEMKVFL